MTCLMALGLLAAACSSNGLDQATTDRATSDLRAHVRVAGLQIDDEATECAVRQFDLSTADALAETELDVSDARPVAEAVVDCARGSAGLGQLLRPLAEAAPDSLDCAVGLLRDDAITGLLASALAGSDGLRSADEVQVTTALSLCLSPEELLDYHR